MYRVYLWERCVRSRRKIVFVFPRDRPKSAVDRARTFDRRAMIVIRHHRTHNDHLSFLPRAYRSPSTPIALVTLLSDFGTRRSRAKITVDLNKLSFASTK